MTEREWKGLAHLVNRWWKGDFDQDTAMAYWLVLQRYERTEVEQAFLHLLGTGKPFVPTLPEIIYAMHAEQRVSTPTWEEAWKSIAWAMKASPKPPYDDYDKAKEEAVRNRLRQVHPLVASFVETIGIRHLLMAPVNDPDQGHWEMKRLKAAWEAHVEASEGRENIALARGTGAEGLKKLDPLKGLEQPKPKPKELPMSNEDPLDF